MQKRYLFGNLHLILLALFFANGIFCQTNVQIAKDSFRIKQTTYIGENAVEYINDEKRVLQADEIIYFGTDISRLILTDIDIVGSEKITQKYFPAWIAEFSKKNSSENDVKKLLEKGKMSFRLLTSFDEIQMLYTSRSDQWIKFDKHDLDFNDVKIIISSYSLKEDSGIGFVIIASNFNKVIQRGTSYYVFFDIKSRKILWASFISSKPGGWGMTDYWSRALINSFKYFEQYIYKPAIHNL